MDLIDMSTSKSIKINLYSIIIFSDIHKFCKPHLFYLHLTAEMSWCMMLVKTMAGPYSSYVLCRKSSLAVRS